MIFSASQYRQVDSKMSREKRVKEREAWRELQIVIRNYRALGFDYLIKRPSQTPVSFGSTTERDPCPLKTSNMNSLMKRILYKPLVPVLKSSTATLKKTSTTVTSGETKCNAIFESSVPRFSYKTSNNKLFSPNDVVRAIKLNKIPVNQKSNYEIMVKFVTPPPGTYNIDTKRKYVFSDSFGGKKLLIPATRTLCKPHAFTPCDKCGLKVEGDFWQKSSPLQVYCKSCMNYEKNRAKYRMKRKDLKLKRLAELDSFDRVQDCSFYHQHEGTNASVKLLPKNDVIKRLRWENYLSQFYM